jgi:MFS family permease
MLALGLNDSQVGLIATVYMLSQVVCAFFSGAITDKLGRRRATAMFEFTAWVIPCLIWWRAEGFWFFFVAAVINGTQKIVNNSWTCLLVEDVDKSKITSIYSLTGIASQLAVLLAPVTAILFSRLTLVPAIRIMYIYCAVVMTTKGITLFLLSRETGTGMIRLMETRGKSIFSLVAGYGGILGTIGKSRGIIFAMAIVMIGGGMGTTGIVGMINTTFWQVIVTKKLLVPNSMLPLFVVLKSSVAIFFLFFVMPHLTKTHLKLPLLTAFFCFVIGQVILVLTPAAGPLKYIMLCVSIIFDGFCTSSLTMLGGSLMAIHVDPAERARMMAIIQMIIMPITAPFGWIAGMLSEISRSLPFILNICLLITGFLLTVIFYRKNNPHPEVGAA